MLYSETATEPDSEETDLLARSNKKIKVDMGKATNERLVKQRTWWGDLEGAGLAIN